jgi:hypothetical protein
MSDCIAPAELPDCAMRIAHGPDDPRTAHGLVIFDADLDDAAIAPAPVCGECLHELGDRPDMSYERL